MANIQKDLQQFKNFEKDVQQVKNSLTRIYQRKYALFQQLEDWHFHNKKINVANNIKGLNNLLKLEDRYARTVERKVRRFVKAVKDAIGKVKGIEYRTDQERVYGLLAKEFFETLLILTEDYFIIMKQMDHRRRKEEKFLQKASENSEEIIKFYGKYLEQLKKERSTIGYSDNLKKLGAQLREYDLRLKVQYKALDPEAQKQFNIIPYMVVAGVAIAAGLVATPLDALLAFTFGSAAVAGIPKLFRSF